MGNAMLRDPDSCDPSLSFCTASPQAYTTRLQSLASSMRAKQPDGLVMATFATTAEVQLGEAITWMQWTAPALNIKSHRVFIGYVKR